MPTKLVDAHIHLSDHDFEENLPYITAFLRRAGIVLFSNSMDIGSSLRTLGLSRLLDGKLLSFVGIHPWSAQSESIERFETLLKREKDRVCGIGEIGLDRKYAQDEEAYQKQKSIFGRSLELAERFNKPVSVHSRDSQKDVIDILSSFRLKSVLLHWFSGDYQQLSGAMDRGYYVSFGPTLIYSKRSKALAERTRKELILTETDGPVRYVCFGNKPALPIFITSVIFALSHLLKSDFKETVSMVWKNSSSYMDMKL